jgi:hypothetical protein
LGSARLKPLGGRGLTPLGGKGFKPLGKGNKFPLLELTDLDNLVQGKAFLYHLANDFPQYFLPALLPAILLGIILENTLDKSVASYAHKQLLIRFSPSSGTRNINIENRNLTKFLKYILAQ